MANTTPVRGREGDEGLDLAEVAAMIDEHIVRYFPPETRAVQQVLCLAEEVNSSPRTVVLAGWPVVLGQTRRWTRN